MTSSAHLHSRKRPAGPGGAPAGRASRSASRAATDDGGRLNGAPGQAVFEYDPENESFVWSGGEAAAQVIGQPELGSATAIAALNARIAGAAPPARARALAGELESYCCEYQMARADGALAWIEERGGWISAGEDRRLIGVMRSIDSERRRSAELARRAEYDDLTGVLNRSQLRLALQDAIDAVAKEGEETAGVYLLAGIDDVGRINSNFGFEAADAAIREIAQRLRAVSGKMCGRTDNIGRVAGTKFGIVVSNADQAAVRDVCIKLLNAVRESVIDTEKGSIGASICLGAVELAGPERNAHLIMAQAEAALEEAKQMGPSSWSSFNEKTDIVSMRTRNTKMSDVILSALNERRVHVAFQPIVADLNEAPSKFECLVRMIGQDGEQVPAPDFIPAAERLGLVHLLDRRVLELAINTLAVTPDVELNVNISMETVKDPVWAEGYIALLRANEALTRRITIELTETRVIDAVDASIEFVSEIKGIGASFAMDDFGAGYTSFRNLKALDIDSLKIDGSFVAGVSSSRENQLFVRTLLDLARNFGMTTVAEWVDNEADAMVLKGLGVDYLQGFLIGRPDMNPSWLPDGAPNKPPQRKI